jgi:hypothetical protein
VSIDGAPAKTYNVTEDDPVTRPNAILFFAAGLSDGPHVLHVMKLGNSDDTSYLDLDQVQVTTWTHPTTSLTGAFSIASSSVTFARHVCYANQILTVPQRRPLSLAVL